MDRSKYRALVTAITFDFQEVLGGHFEPELDYFLFTIASTDAAGSVLIAALSGLSRDQVTEAIDWVIVATNATKRARKKEVN